MYYQCFNGKYSLRINFHYFLASLSRSVNGPLHPFKLFQWGNLVKVPGFSYYLANISWKPHANEENWTVGGPVEICLFKSVTRIPGLSQSISTLGIIFYSTIYPFLSNMLTNKTRQWTGHFFLTVRMYQSMIFVFLFRGGGLACPLVHLESIEHNYIRKLKSQSYKQMST